MGNGSYIVVGDNSSFNSNDVNYLMQVIADKDEFIKVLKDDYDRMHAEYDVKIDNLFQQIKDKDKREELIVRNSYNRNEECLKRFAEKDRLLAEKDKLLTDKEAIIGGKDLKIAELYEKIIELSSTLRK